MEQGLEALPQTMIEPNPMVKQHTVLGQIIKNKGGYGILNSWGGPPLSHELTYVGRKIPSDFRLCIILNDSQ